MIPKLKSMDVSQIAGVAYKVEFLFCFHSWTTKEQSRSQFNRGCIAGRGQPCNRQ